LSKIETHIPRWRGLELLASRSITPRASPPFRGRLGRCCKQTPAL